MTNKWHIEKLEQVFIQVPPCHTNRANLNPQVMKFLENELLDPTAVDAIKDDVEFYIEVTDGGGCAKILW